MLVIIGGTGGSATAVNRPLGTGPALAQHPRQMRYMEAECFNVFFRTKTNLGCERPLNKELFRPLARTAFYTLRGAAPQIRARMPISISSGDQAPIFIIGCGRSGTTLLGELFAKHPELSYRYEPYHRW